MIPGDIGTALIIVLGLAVFFVAARAKRREPETFGNPGDMPTDGHQPRSEPLPAPDIGFGLRVGSKRITYEEWVASGERDEFMRASRSARVYRPQNF